MQPIPGMLSAESPISACRSWKCSGGTPYLCENNEMITTAITISITIVITKSITTAITIVITMVITIAITSITIAITIVITIAITFDAFKHPIINEEE